MGYVIACEECHLNFSENEIAVHLKNIHGCNDKTIAEKQQKQKIICMDCGKNYTYRHNYLGLILLSPGKQYNRNQSYDKNDT